MTPEAAPFLGPRPPLRQSAVSALIDEIVAGRLPPGSRLPPEPTLCARFGVSRTVVREAAKVLEEKGLITIRHGHGSVVAGRESWSLLDPDLIAAQLEHDDAGRLFEELTVVRLALEGEMAARAASVISDEQAAELREVIAAAGRSLQDPDQFLELDVRFHALLMEVSGNRVASAIMRSIESALRSSRRITNRIPGGMEKAHQFHSEICRSVIAHDPGAARTAMEQHLEWSLTTLKQASLASAPPRRRR